jgi:hypothetical protein
MRLGLFPSQRLRQDPNFAAGPIPKNSASCTSRLAAVSVSFPSERTEAMDDYACPRCKRRATTVRYRERQKVKAASEWIMEYRCPRGHKWFRVMDPGRPKKNA